MTSEIVKTITITSGAFALFQFLVKESANWNGTPMLDLNPEQKGYFTAIKKAGLMSSFASDGIMWGAFSWEGIIEVNGVRFSCHNGGGTYDVAQLS